MLTLFKVLKALFRFIREIWLRDRTFRQFVRENLSLIVTSFGFMIMTFMFTHVYFIVTEQEDIIAGHVLKEAVMQKDLDRNTEIRARLDWYRDRYFELKGQYPPDYGTVLEPPKPPVKHTEPKESSVPSNPPSPKQSAPKPAATRPPTNDFVERWKKLSQ